MEGLARWLGVRHAGWRGGGIEMTQGCWTETGQRGGGGGGGR